MESQLNLHLPVWHDHVKWDIFLSGPAILTIYNEPRKDIVLLLSIYYGRHLYRQPELAGNDDMLHGHGQRSPSDKLPHAIWVSLGDETGA